MNSPISCFRALLIFSALLAIPTAAPADTYEIYDLGSGHLSNVVGITASGTVVINEVGVFDYETWVNGVEVSVSPTNPGLTYDNGAPCSTVPPGFTSVSRCNNGHEIYATDRYAAAPYANMIFDGPDLATDFVVNGDLDEIFLNSSGDFVFTYDQGTMGIDGDGFIGEAIDLTTSSTPEPSGILLLATGLCAAIAASWFHRRASAPRQARMI